MSIATRPSQIPWASVLGVVLLAACATDPESPPVTNDGEPFRFWSYGTYPGDRGPEIPGEIHNSNVPMSDVHDFGPLRFVVDGDQRATGEVISGTLGESYGISTQGPTGGVGDPATSIGSTVELQQIMDYTKNTTDASFILHVSAIELEGIDASNSGDPGCETGPPGRFICHPNLTADVKLTVMVYGDTGIFFASENAISLISRFGQWTLSSTSNAPGQVSLWNLENFATNFTPGAPVQSVTRANLSLAAPLNIPLDISEVDTGSNFTVRIFARAETYDLTQRETYLAAGFKRPTNVVGATIETQGLEPTGNSSRPVPPLSGFGSAPECPAGGNPGAGTLQFRASAFEVPELPFGGLEQATVIRVGGSSGKVSAVVTSSDGSAIAGTDYTPITTTVTFGDNDAAPRTIPLPVLLNSTPSSNKTVNLQLSDPRGCATLGPSNAVLTIVDDDQPVENPVFAIGGTVTGLTGSGLSLRNFSTGEILPVDLGAFAFAQRSANGLSYDVGVNAQPTNPAQVCAVSNGSGTVSGADVNNISVACVTPTNGGIDLTFSGDGKVQTLLSGALGGAVALQTDGRIVVVGASDQPGHSDFTLLRYDGAGVLDPSFGTGGIVTTNFSATSRDEGTDVLVQPDGKIVVAGRSAVVGVNFDFALARYRTDGSLDSTFGSGGMVVTDFGAGQATARALALLPDGRILAVGEVGGDFALARYHADGRPDSTFGTAGKATLDLNGGDIANSVALLADGRFIVAGGAAIGSERDFGVVRFNENGTIDLGFGASGLTSTDFGGVDMAFDIVVEPDGRIVAAGSIDGPGGAQGVDFAVARYTAEGRPDSSFSGDGRVTTNFTAGRDRAAALVRQADGKLVVAGLTTSSSFAFNNFAVARYLTTGELDLSFGIGGTLAIDIAGGHSNAAGLVIQGDGRIVAAGTTTSSTGFAVVRLVP